LNERKCIFTTLTGIVKLVSKKIILEMATAFDCYNVSCFVVSTSSLILPGKSQEDSATWFVDGSKQGEYSPKGLVQG
jgi:hypothetical protein